MNGISTLNGTEIQEGQFRDINIITTEIRVLYEEGTRTELTYAIQIGRRLKEAKELLGHGEWGDWCKENLPFSQSKANKLMAVHEKFGADQESIFGTLNSETFTNLGISQAFALLSLPDEEREDFVQTHDVENMSVRELQKQIDEANAERDAAKKRAEELDTDNRKLRESNIDLNRKAQESAAEAGKVKNAIAEAEKAKLEKEAAEERAKVARENEKAAKEKLNAAVTAEQEARSALAEAKANPEIPEEKLKELERLAAEKAEKAAAERQAAAERDLQERISELEKKLTMSDPDIAVFKTLFTQMQKAQNEAVECLMTITQKNPETGAKLTAAFKAAVSGLLKRLEG